MKLNTGVNQNSTSIKNHILNDNNPHNVTPSQLGLDNTTDNEKNVLSASKWTTARTLTIGSTGKAVDGTKNVTWSLEEIGAAAKDHEHDSIKIDDDYIVQLVTDTFYPIGSIKFTYENINPGTYISETSWELISQGKYIRGVDPNDSNLNTAKTGGNKTLDLSHSHTIAAHSHTVANHVHSTANHTLTISQIPSHIHSATCANGGSHYHEIQFTKREGYRGSNADGYLPTDNDVYTKLTYRKTTTAAAHKHTVTIGANGSGGAHNHGNTGGASPATDSKALTTSAGLNQIANEPEYQTLYCWKRVA